MRAHPARIGIFHLSMNPCGGAERLTLVLAEALMERGYNVELIVTERTDWGRIRRIIGMDRHVFDKEILIPPLVTLPTIYSKFLCWLLRDVVFVPHLKRRYDLTITTMPTLPIVFSDVLYIHFPDFIPPFLDRYYRKYSSNGMRAYSLPFKLICSLSVQVFRALQNKPLVLTNSKYTHIEIQRYLDVASSVVYPPVDTGRYMSSSRNRSRDNIVLTISRIGEGKILHIIPQLAKKVSDAKFIIIGGSHGARSRRYMASITREVNQLRLGDRVLIMPNLTENEKVELLSRAKIYLHTTRFEHFGISIVEAMSAGVVPVVHRSGGPWIDILKQSQGTYGYAYENIDEASAIMNRLLEDEDFRMKLSKRAAKRATDFDSSKFKQSMERVVEHLLESKLSKRGRRFSQNSSTTPLAETSVDG